MDICEFEVYSQVYIERLCAKNFFPLFTKGSRIEVSRQRLESSWQEVNFKANILVYILLILFIHVRLFP